MQRNVAALENRTSAHREIFLALVAAVEAASPLSNPLAQSADRTARAVRPQPAFKVGPGRLLVREHLEKLEGRNRALAHSPTLNFWQNPSLENRGSQVYKSPNYSRCYTTPRDTIRLGRGGNGSRRFAIPFKRSRSFNACR